MIVSLQYSRTRWTNILDSRNCETHVSGLRHQIGGILPNDHGDGNKGECPCVGTEREIFERVDRGMYRVRDLRS